MHEDFPKNELDFDRRFNHEQTCLDYLFQLRWPEGFICPGCGHTENWKSIKGLYFLQTMQPPAICYCWNNLSLDEETTHGLV
ncbi:MAG: transposase [Desulfuromonadales bacterium]